MQKDLLPAAFSFCLPGLGQLYQGRHVPALSFFFGFAIFSFLSVGRYVLPVVAFAAATEAFFKTPPAIRPGLRFSRRVSLYGTVGVIGLLAWMSIASPAFLPVGVLWEVQRSADGLRAKIELCQSGMGKRPVQASDCPGIAAEGWRDPWGSDFEYRPTAQGFQLISRGRDRQLGTSDDFRFTFY